MFERFMNNPDWEVLTDTFEWIKNMKGSTQDPIHHAEGDVWIHTKMVLEELLLSDEYQALNHANKTILFVTALLHDVAKPITRREENGRITNKGHSRIGAIMAREILWKMNFDPAMREQICSLISYHQVPFWLIERPEWQAQKNITEISLSTNNRLLAIFAKADALGRICTDKQKLLTNIDLFSIMSEELGCLENSYRFFNDHTRVQYFLDPESKSILNNQFDPTTFTVHMMSGIPGSGKSTVAHDLKLPIISLDNIRSELKIDPTDNQGMVIQTARERAKIFLRKKESFVWDATNLSKEIRGMVLPLFHDYGAHTVINYVEAKYSDVVSRNESRGRDMVPINSIQRMLKKWEYPTLSEAYSLKEMYN